MEIFARPPFERTRCACPECVECCHRQPGHLIPGDFERITEFLKIAPEEALKYFWASPGGKMMNLETRTIRQVRTITPRMEKGKCVFLDENDRCKIHPVAPFGCAYFSGCDNRTSTSFLKDQHQRSVWGLVEIHDSNQYKALRSKLPLATSYKPRPLPPLPR